MKRLPVFCKICFLVILSLFLGSELRSNLTAEELSVLFTDGFRGRLQSDGHHQGLDAFVEPLQNHRESHGASQVITVDLGNSVAPFYLSRMDNGDSMVSALASLGYDVMVPGNSEFEFGTDFFTSAKANELAFVCANLLKPDGSRFLPPYRLFERGGMTVAVIGIMDVEMRKLILDENFVISTGELQLVEPTAVLQDLVPKAQREADRIIVISNLPYEANYALAHQVDGIDILISKQGKQLQTHRTDLQKASSNAGEENRTFIFTSESGYLGQIALEEDADAKFQLGGFHRIKVNSPLTPAPLLMGKIEALERRFQAYCQQQFNTEPDAALIHLSPETRDEDFARYLVGVLVSRTRSDFSLIDDQHFDFSYWNDIARDNQLTLRECFLLIPENYGLLSRKLHGSELNRLARQNQQERAEGGDRLHFVSRGILTDKDGEKEAPWGIHHRPIQDDETYTGATSTLLANGASIFDLTNGRSSETKWRSKDLRLALAGSGSTHLIRDILIYHLMNATSHEKPLPTGEALSEEQNLKPPVWRFAISNIGLSLTRKLFSKREEYPEVTIPELRGAEVRAKEVNGTITLARETSSMLWDVVLNSQMSTAKLGEVLFLQSQDDLSLTTNLTIKSLNVAGIRPTVGMSYDTEYHIETERRIIDGKPGVFEFPRQQDYLVWGGVMLPDVSYISGTSVVLGRVIDVRSEPRRNQMTAVALQTRVIVPIPVGGGKKITWVNGIGGLYYLPDDVKGSERRQVQGRVSSMLRIPTFIENLALLPTFNLFFYKGQDKSDLALQYLFYARVGYSHEWKW